MVMWMPVEVFDVDEFVRLSEFAEVCRVKRVGGFVKLKLRTRGRLYTLKLEPSESEGVIERLRCGLVEV